MPNLITTQEPCKTVIKEGKAFCFAHNSEVQTLGNAIAPFCDFVDAEKVKERTAKFKADMLLALETLGER